MLRRYNSRGVDTVIIESRRTVGRQNCDINVEGEGVSSPHVAIELHPFTRTYWLRELSLTESTTVNGRHVNGQVELHSGDFIQLGSAQPLVFEERSLFPATRKISSEMHSVSTNKSYEAPLQNGLLPVLGHKLVPQQTNFRTLNGSRSSSAQRTQRSKRSTRPTVFRERRLNATAATPNSLDSISSPGSIDSNLEVSPRAVHQNGVPSSVFSVGNSLLQRVVRLQSEVSRKDEEATITVFRSHVLQILTLLHRLRSFEKQFPKLGKNGFSNQNKKDSRPMTPLNFELEAYRCFIHVMSRKLHQFNETALSRPQKDYADILSKFSRSMEEPFLSKMGEIEEDCRKALHLKGFDEIQLSRLRPFMGDEHKEYFASLAQELERIFPVIRDATATARESISVCTVFTQWSLNLGKGLREYGLKSSLLHHAIDCLKDQFTYSDMAKHWLPPAIAPLFRLIALELERKESRQQRDTQTDKESGEVTPEPHIRVQRAVLAESVPFEEDTLDILITKAEGQTIQLQHEINSLSDTIRNELDMDKTTEEHLEDLCNILHSIGETLQRFTDQNGRKHHKTSIISVEVKHEDIAEGLQQMRADCETEILGVRKRSGDSPSRHNSPRTPGYELKKVDTLDTEALETLRETLFTQLKTEVSSPSDVHILIRKDILTDLIFAAVEFSRQLESPKDHSFEADDEGEEVMKKVTVGEAAATPEGSIKGDSKRSSLRETLLLGNIQEESHEEEHHPEEQEEQTEEETGRVRREASLSEKIHTAEANISERSNAAEEVDDSTRKTEEEVSRKTSITSLGVISSEEYVNHGGERINSPSAPSRSEEKVDPASIGSRRTSEVLEQQAEEFFDEPETILPDEETEQHSFSPMQIPLIEMQSPSPVSRQLSGQTLINRPRSARPRTSVETKMGNGQVAMGNESVMRSPSLGAEILPIQSFLPIEKNETDVDKSEWSSVGTTEEMSLPATTIDDLPATENGSPVPIQAEQEKQLMEARKKATQRVADSILNAPKPKNICDYSHSAHIQSHINTASRQPAVSTKVPVNSFDFFNSPPQQKKKAVKIEEAPPLRQPRMQFKL